MWCAKVIGRAHQEHARVQRHGVAGQCPATARQRREACPECRVQPFDVGGVAQFNTYMDPPRFARVMFADGRQEYDCTHISVYGLLSACKLKMMMSDREPHAYIRPLVGERPPGPDVMRICV